MSAAIEVEDLTISFAGSLWRRAAPFRAVDGLSLSVAAGETLGLVGESGSGKTTLGRAILGLQPPSAGQVRVGGITPGLPGRAARRAFARRVQCVFQDSTATFNPRMSLGAALREGLDIHRIGAPATRAAQVGAMLDRVGLPRAMAERYPHEVSGGQRQRANIARSLMLDPAVLIADEPVSALDVSVQAQILDLLADLKAERGLTLLLITHDLGVVREVADRVAVMQAGRIVECQPTAALFAQPRHAHTRALIAAGPDWAAISAPPVQAPRAG